jgi:cytochrome c oxidase subunit II
VLAVGGLAGVALSGCQAPAFGSYHGSTTQGNNTFRLWQGFNIGAIVIGALIWVLILWAVIRYRRRDDRVPRQTRYNIRWEILYTVTPIVLVSILFAFTVIVENRVDAISPHPTVNLKVTAFQWGWRFDYVGDHVTVVGNYNRNPELVLPVNDTVRINLVSNDVVHEFYVPAFNFGRFAQPGVVNVFDFNVTKPGEYQGRCAEYCGLYHSQMLFNLRAIPTAEFQAWLTSHRTRAAA